MTTTTEINRRNNIRNQINRQEQGGKGGDPYFNAARNSIQSQFRFLLRINGMPFALITDVDRPSPNFAAPKEYQLLNWKFKYPGAVVSWDNLTFTIAEVFDSSLADSVSGLIMDKFKNIGYDNPNQVDANNLKDMNKSDLMASLGDVIIQILDPDGDVYEQWSLYGAFVSGIKFSKLGYNANGISNSTVTIAYDWAALTYINNDGLTKTY